MQYTVVKDFNQDVFEFEVRQKLKEGWQLHGGVSIAVNSQTLTTYFAQAFTKESKQ